MPVNIQTARDNIINKFVDGPPNTITPRKLRDSLLDIIDATSAEANVAAAIQARDDAEAARDATQTFEADAGTHEDNAEQAVTDAQTARDSAQTAEAGALAHRSAAEAAKVAAETARDDSQNHASDSSSSATDADNAKTGAELAKTQAETARDAAIAASETNNWGFTFDSGTLAADPGTARVRFNSTTLASATTMYVSQSADEGDLADVIASWDDSNSAIKATIKLRNPLAPTNWAEMHINGLATDHGDYWSLPVMYVGSNGTLNNDDSILLAVIRTGDTGTGAVDSFNGRTGAVNPTASDYDASQIDNDSGVSGATVANALDQLNSSKANSAHNHAINDIAGLQPALDGKANNTHTHGINDTSGLQTALDGKANSSHTHGAGDVSGLGSFAMLSQVPNDHITTDMLAPYAKHVTTVDWNTIIENGWYQGHDTTNNPLGSDVRWWIGIVTAHNHLWVTQELWDFSSTQPTHYRRYMNNGTWLGWGQVGELANDSVTAAKIAANAVGTSEIAADAVTANEIESGAVGASEIADNSVTLAEMEHGTAGDIFYYGASGAPTRLAKGSSGKVLTQGSNYPFWGDAGGGVAASSYGDSGYVKFDDGLIVQWGKVGLGTVTVTFPLAFPSKCAAVVSTAINSLTAYARIHSAATTTQVVIGNGGFNVEKYWIAVGY